MEGAAEFLTDILKKVTENMFSVAPGTTSSLSDFHSGLYDYIYAIATTIVQPIAYVILALFLMTELVRAAQKTEGMSTNAGMLGTQIPFTALVKALITKTVIDYTPLIMNAIFEVFAYIGSKIQTYSISGYVADFTALEAELTGLSFWSLLGAFILIIITALIMLITTVVASLISTVRMVELYIYFAVAPIPLATFPSDELSQIGKNFLKSFAAVSLQGVLIIIVLNMFPVLATSISTSEGDLYLQIGQLLGYSLLLLISLFSTQRWAKSICNAM